jgi:hypothetical protein
MYRCGLLIGGGPGPAQNAIAGSREAKTPLGVSDVKLGCSQCRAGPSVAKDGKGGSISRLMTRNFCPDGAFHVIIGIPGHLRSDTLMNVTSTRNGN